MSESVEEFLKRGGEINNVPRGVSAETLKLKKKGYKHVISEGHVEQYNDNLNPRKKRKRGGIL